MPENDHSSIRSQVIAGLVIAAVLGAVSFIPGLFSWLAGASSDFWSHLNGTSEFPNWGLYLLALMSIHTLIYFAVRVMKPKGPKLTAYNQDSFLGLTWRWSYISGRPFNTWAFCPHCDTALVYSEGSRYDPDQKTILTCESCNSEQLRHEGSKDYLVEKINRQIDRKIRNREWLHVVQSNS